MNEQPKVFIYLDASGIESLFAQTVDRVEIEIRASTENEASQKGKAKFGFSKGLAALFGAEVGAELEAGKAKKQLEESKSTLTVENKLARLRNYLRQSSNLATTMPSALSKAASANASVFLEVDEPFDLPQFVKGGGGITQANKDGAILFQLDEQIGSGKVVMAASLTKFPSAAGGHMSRLSHLALHIASFSGKGMSINVFGYIRHLGNGTFQIKPYAIW